MGRKFYIPVVTVCKNNSDQINRMFESVMTKCGVKFKPYYVVLDNSDPGNPFQLRKKLKRSVKPLIVLDNTQSMLINYVELMTSSLVKIPVPAFKRDYTIQWLIDNLNSLTGELKAQEFMFIDPAVELKNPIDFIDKNRSYPIISDVVQDPKTGKSTLLGLIQYFSSTTFRTYRMRYFDYTPDNPIFTENYKPGDFAVSQIVQEEVPFRRIQSSYYVYLPDGLNAVSELTQRAAASPAAMPGVAPDAAPLPPDTTTGKGPEITQTETAQQQQLQPPADTLSGVTPDSQTLGDQNSPTGAVLTTSAANTDTTANTDTVPEIIVQPEVQIPEQIPATVYIADSDTESTDSDTGHARVSVDVAVTPDTETIVETPATETPVEPTGTETPATETPVEPTAADTDADSSTDSNVTPDLISAASLLAGAENADSPKPVKASDQKPETEDKPSGTTAAVINDTVSAAPEAPVSTDTHDAPVSDTAKDTGTNASTNTSTDTPRSDQRAKEKCKTGKKKKADCAPDPLPQPRGNNTDVTPTASTVQDTAPVPEPVREPEPVKEVPRQVPDILYVMGKGNACNDDELINSLRNIEKYACGYGRIFISGPKLSRFINKDRVIWHKYDDDPTNFEENIDYQIRAVCQETDISDNFILMIDNIFLDRHVDLSSYPVHYRREYAVSPAAAPAEPETEPAPDTGTAARDANNNNNNSDDKENDKDCPRIDTAVNDAEGTDEKITDTDTDTVPPDRPRATTQVQPDQTEKKKEPEKTTGNRTEPAGQKNKTELPDVLYVLGKGSIWHDNEIKYSLRSLQLNGRNFNRIFIAAARLPEFIDPKKVILVPCNDDPNKNGWLNVFNKVVRVLKTTDISSKFVFMMDDVFLTKTSDFLNYPYFVKGELKPDYGSPKKWLVSKAKTYHLLAKKNLPALDFDLHAPVVYDKKLYLESAAEIQACVNDNIFPQPRSYYCNRFNVAWVRAEDLKLKRRHLPNGRASVKQAIGDLPFFSVSDEGLVLGAAKYLKDWLKNPSYWEVGSAAVRPCFLR